MKSCVLIAVLIAAASWAAEGRDLTEHVRFLADFDSPVQMGGELYPDPPKEGWEVEGKFGKGFHFYRETNNKLLPMAQFFASAMSRTSFRLAFIVCQTSGRTAS